MSITRNSERRAGRSVLALGILETRRVLQRAASRENGSLILPTRCRPASHRPARSPDTAGFDPLVRPDWPALVASALPQTGNGDAPACFGHVDLQNGFVGSSFMLLNANQQIGVQLVIPNNPAFLSTNFHSQTLTLLPGINALGSQSTNGLCANIGQ